MCVYLRAQSFPFDACDRFIQFGIYQPCRVSLLEPKQGNLSYPDAYSEPCQKTKMVFFAKILTLKAVNFFC